MSTRLPPFDRELYASREAMLRGNPMSDDYKCPACGSRACDCEGKHIPEGDRARWEEARRVSTRLSTEERDDAIREAVGSPRPSNRAPGIAQDTLDAYLSDAPPDGWHEIDNLDPDEARHVAQLAIAETRAARRALRDLTAATTELLAVIERQAHTPAPNLLSVAIGHAGNKVRATIDVARAVLSEKPKEPR